LLFVGDDWAEAHHDVEVMDATGSSLATCDLTSQPRFASLFYYLARPFGSVDQRPRRLCPGLVIEDGEDLRGDIGSAGWVLASDEPAIEHDPGLEIRGA
jgi:hypothetical protein